MSRAARIAIAVVAVAAAVILFVVLSEDDSSDSSEPAPTEATAPKQPEADDGRPPGDEPKPVAEPKAETIVVEGGKPVGGVAELSFTKGERIRFAVESDVADHVHLHGYDVFMDVSAGGRVAFDVPATIEGVFEAELEDRAEPLAEITVNPG